MANKCPNSTDEIRKLIIIVILAIHLISPNIYHTRRFQNKCDSVKEPNFGPTHLLCPLHFHTSESFVDVFRPWFDCQSNADNKFLYYSGNVYCKSSLERLKFKYFEIVIQSTTHFAFQTFWRKGYGYALNYEQSCPLLADIFHRMDQITLGKSR